jgi:hypothetical protein
MAGSALTVTSASKTLAKYGDTYTMTGYLASGAKRLGSRQVVLQSSSNNSSFVDTPVRATTAGNGTFALRVTPSNAAYYRVRFAGAGVDYDAAVSSSRRVVPRAYVSTPKAAKTMYKNKSKNVYGYLKPRHAPRTHPVKIQRWRKVGKKWKSYRAVLTTATNYSAYSKYSVKLKLPVKGKWRLKAYAPADSGHAASYSSGYDYVTVK